jgi:hypothetical protein
VPGGLHRVKHRAFRAILAGKGMRGMAGFCLSKWYLDCVTDAGDVIVAYAATLQWGRLRLRWAATLTQRRGGEARSDATLLGVEEPSQIGAARAGPTGHVGGDIVWGSERLRIEGRWTALEPPVGETLFASPRGKVEWTCHQPRARARGNFAGAAFEGFGYAEHLVLTCAPWSLPIDELRWGRFLGKSSSLVWIDWRGPHTKQLVACSGVRSGCAQIDDRSVVSADRAVALSIEDGTVLRRGPIGKTALADLAGSGKVRMPLRILEVEEKKWRARGSLRAHGRTDHGWVIHEVVRWPPRARESAQ